ncbi:MAG TPA: dienelactone hydrolase family protein, partial [Thermoanaerobaculia bacterium]|nr:dienelactone hydrolase family protein [Thermoanaerobaculia bacterium]
MSGTTALAILTFTLGVAASAAARAADPGDAGRQAQQEQATQLAQMAAEHQHDRPTATPAAAAAPARPVNAEEVAFGELAGKPLRGYLAQPVTSPGKASGGTAAAPVPLAGIIVIHEWWGLNDNVKAMTRRLAGEGYVALAVDLYGGKVADNPDGAKQLMGAVMADRASATATLRAADEFLKRQGAPKIGVIGWCFGGGWSLAAALDLPEGIDAAVMYYGQPEKDRARLERLRAPLLGLFGADDKSILPAAVKEMEATLKQLGKNVEIHIYDGAGHAFANPSGT